MQVKELCMQGLTAWSLPFTRIAGITVRIHLLFLLYVLAEVGRTSQFGTAVVLEVLLMFLMLFGIVLLHELGHCFAARSVGGSAEEILLWPLGGLAYVRHPHNPWASFITTAGGPAVNLVLYLFAGAIILLFGLWPPLSPLWSSFFGDVNVIGGGTAPLKVQPWYVVWLIRFFWLNWLLFWFNVLCVGFPLDGGKLLQAALWPRLGYYHATKIACYCGFAVAIILALVGYWMGKDHYESVMLTLGLSFFIIISCYLELQQLEMGGMEDDVFGYDFSQGYTSLERSARAKERRPSFLKRWLAARAERRRQREEEERIAEDQRMDTLLAKMAEGGGIQALSSEEQRFMKRVSARLRQKRRNG
jgi:Zn-dependent protease